MLADGAPPAWSPRLLLPLPHLLRTQIPPQRHHAKDQLVFLHFPDDELGYVLDAELGAKLEDEPRLGYVPEPVTVAAVSFAASDESGPRWARAVRVSGLES